MTLPIYNAWRNVSSTPSEYWKESLQAMIDDQFENASTLAIIQEEQTFGKLDWSNDLKVRITHIVSDKNTGEKLGDDFRNVIFSDMSHKCILGQRYSFDSNYWIIVNTDKYKYPTISACIRRANNVLNNYDNFGVLHTEPCIIDTKIRSTDFDFNSNIIIPDGYTTILVQGNSWTKTYHLNQRFMFGGQAWKCTFVNNFQRINTLDNSSVNLIRMILMKDNLAPDDDIVNNIPNITTYNYIVTIDQGTTLEQQIGYSSTLSATVKKNGEIINENVIWSTSNEDIVTVNSNGLINLVAQGNAVVTATMQNNSSISASISITVDTIVEDIYEVRITPQVTKLLTVAPNNTQQYQVYLYKNNVQQVDAFVCTPSNINNDGVYYTFTQNSGNSFTVTNRKLNSSPLIITCVSGSHSNSISITLAGIW